MFEAENLMLNVTAATSPILASSTSPVRGRPRTKHVIYQSLTSSVLPFFNNQDPIFYGSQSQSISPPWQNKELPDLPLEYSSSKRLKLDPVNQKTSFENYMPPSCTDNLANNPNRKYLIKNWRAVPQSVSIREALHECDFENVTVNQLKETLRKFNVNCSGKKAALVERVKELARSMANDKKELQAVQEEKYVILERQLFDDFLSDGQSSSSPVESPPELFL